MNKPWPKTWFQGEIAKLRIFHERIANNSGFFFTIIVGFTSSFFRVYIKKSFRRCFQATNKNCPKPLLNKLAGFMEYLPKPS